MVSAISAGQLNISEDNPYGVFMAEFSEYMSSLGRKVSRNAYSEPRRPARAREMKLPRFINLLRRCTAFGVNPAHVLQDPLGAARAACQLEFARLDLPTDVKPRKPKEVIEVAAKRFELEFARQDYDDLPSLASIAKDLGVSKGFLNYRFKKLVAKYTKHRAACLKIRHQRQRDKVVEFLASGPLKNYPSAKYPSHDHLALAASREVGVGIRMARIGLCVALRAHLGRRAYQRYRKSAGLHTPRKG